MGTSCDFHRQESADPCGWNDRCVTAALAIKCNNRLTATVAICDGSHSQVITGCVNSCCLRQPVIALRGLSRRDSSYMPANSWPWNSQGVLIGHVKKPYEL